jgi:hypothetical protein
MDEKCRKRLREAGVCPALDGLMQDSSEDIRHASCKTVCAMAKDEESAGVFVKVGTLRLLVNTIRTQVFRPCRWRLCPAYVSCHNAQ